MAHPVSMFDENLVALPTYRQFYDVKKPEKESFLIGQDHYKKGVVSLMLDPIGRLACPVTIIT